MRPTDPGDGRRAVLFTRTDLPRPARTRRAGVVRELGRLAEDERLAGVAVRPWAKRVPAGEASTERSRYAAFTEWARENGVDLDPPFGRRTCYAPATGGWREELVLPTLCLALYENGSLALVAPHAEDGTPFTVSDALAAIGRRERVPDPEVEAETVASP